eukprot:7729386-Heterocapsa_arctica.AAC.1
MVLKKAWGRGGGVEEGMGPRWRCQATTQLEHLAGTDADPPERKPEHGPDHAEHTEHTPNAAIGNDAITEHRRSRDQAMLG